MAEESPIIDPEDELSLLDLLLVLAENARLLVLGPLVAGIIALGYSYLITPTFTATTKILPPQQQQSTAALLASQLGVLSSLAGAAGLNLRNPSDLYVALIRSRTIGDRMIDRFDLMQLYGAKLRLNARLKLEGVTTIIAGRDGLITIEVDDPDPKRAANIANAYVEELSRMNDSIAITEAQQRRAFFEQQLKKAKDGLITAEKALKATGVNESAVKASPDAAVGVVASLMAQVAAKEVQIGAMRGSFTESSPDLKRAQMELGALRLQLSRIDKDNQLAAGGSDYVARYRDFKYHETFFELLAKQYEAARLDEARDSTVIQVVDVAIPPEWKSSPKRAQLAVFTTLIAGFVLMIFVFARESLRNARKNPEYAGKLARIALGLGRLNPRKSQDTTGPSEGAIAHKRPD